MFNIGITELIFLAGLALILIGPKQLPDVARTIGRFINELKRSTESFQSHIKTSMNDDTKPPAVDTENKNGSENI